MRVTRLDLVGFKSFADKTRLEFTPGITAIVGPNGCGKSNIADAIRWVFGEQRVKALRGGSMEDVIFAGTDRRHPLGMAEVLLTIDNAEGRLHTPFTEVSIGRRRYRSGESEYLMNQAQCRRQDVIETFQDTGMGLDAYCYIEQGRIDMVLSTKPEDRRHIFEDAAGIVRYRKRQAEAMRKLERTDHNLARLADTIQEVQRRCRSLKRQASAASRYRTLQEELRAQELRLARHQYDGAAAELHTRTGALREITTRLEGTGARVSIEEAAIEQARLNQIELESQLSHAQQDVYTVETDIDRAEAHIRVLEEKRRAAEDRATAATEEVRILRARTGQLSEQGAHARRAAAQAEVALAATVEAVAEAEREMQAVVEQIPEAEARLEAERQASLRVLNDKIAAENRRASVGSQLERAAGRLTQIADRIRHAEQQVAIQARRLAESRNRAERLARERTATREALAGAEADRGRCHAALAGAESELASQREALSATVSKLRSLEQVRDRFEGFQIGVKTVLQARRAGAPWTTGVRGALADLVRISPRYEVALEAALGPYLQCIVTGDAAEADRVIAALRDAECGRVTCLPLAGLRALPSSRAPVPAAGEAGVVGWAVDLAEADAILRDALAHLLGDTLIVESAEVARSLAGQLRPAPRLVTLDGDLLESTGIRSGGAVQRGTGLLGRHNEIARLARDVTGLESQVATRTETIAELEAELQTIEARVGEFAQHAATLDVEIRGLEQDCERSIEALDTARGQAQHVRRDSAAVLEERTGLLAEQDRIATELQQLAAREAQVQTRVVDAQHGRSALLGQKDAVGEQLTARQVERSAAAHTLAAHQREGERLGALLEDTESRLAGRREEVEQARATCSDVDREVAETRTRIQERNLAREEAQRAVTDLQQLRGGLVSSITEREQALRDERQAHQALTEEAHGLDVEVTRLQDRLAALRDHILTTYQVDLVGAPGLPSAEAADADTGGAPDEMWDPETAVQLVADLKQRLERMGPVNLIAIEEYEEYRARAEYLEQQDADLRLARETLLRVISEIGTTIEQRFLETFAQVQQHFHDVFRLLFEGGRGRLALADPEHPLECGIDIDVQPPGKHLQSISLLSGGERALTAAALLFAVFRTRPSPFCILDEIDAPLDDTNVIRLCRLIARFAPQTQFIIITHNKRTMELADTLYGVTMEERGVSQLVSVRLTRESDTPAAESDIQVGVAAA